MYVWVKGKRYRVHSKGAIQLLEMYNHEKAEPDLLTNEERVVTQLNILSLVRGVDVSSYLVPQLQ